MVIRKLAARLGLATSVFVIVGTLTACGNRSASGDGGTAGAQVDGGPASNRPDSGPADRAGTDLASTAAAPAVDAASQSDPASALDAAKSLDTSSVLEAGARGDDAGPELGKASAIDAVSRGHGARDAGAATHDAAVAADSGAIDVRAPADTAPKADAPVVADSGQVDVRAPVDTAPKDGLPDAALPSDAGRTALAPAQGALLGMLFGTGTMADREALIGRQMAIHLTYYAWSDDWAGSVTKADLAAGRIPLVNWEPDGVDFNNIVNGSLDSTIKARAAGAKALGQNFFLDFAAEMNGDEAWSGNNPTLYVAAYRHIHDIFVAAGATNVVWAWCPNVTDVGGGNRSTMDYYPGDTYVDWLGVDGYNWGAVGGDWQSFQDVFARIYPLLAAKGRPILIGETACASVGGDKAAWIDAIIPTLKTSFPLVKGLVWFDKNKEADWRIDSSPESLAAFQRMASDPYFMP